jgi:hypothetical protein
MLSRSLPKPIFLPFGRTSRRTANRVEQAIYDACRFVAESSFRRPLPTGPHQPFASFFDADTLGSSPKIKPYRRPSFPSQIANGVGVMRQPARSIRGKGSEGLELRPGRVSGAECGCTPRLHAKVSGRLRPTGRFWLYPSNHPVAWCCSLSRGQSNRPSGPRAPTIASPLSLQVTHFIMCP